MILKEKQTLGMRVNYLSISHDGYWFVSYCNGSYDANLPSKCGAAFDSLIEDGSTIINRIWLGKNDVFCIAYQTSNERIALSPWQVLFSELSYLTIFHD